MKAKFWIKPIVLVGIVLQAWPAWSAESAQTAAEQRAVAEVAGELEQRLIELLLLEEQQNPEKARRLKAALDAMRERQVARTAQQAAQQLEAGRRRQALESERAVHEALRDVLGRLTTPRYEEQIEDYLKYRDELKSLLGEQRAIRNRTGKLDPKEQKAFDDVFDRQRRLGLEAANLASRMARGVPPVPGGEHLKAAGKPMDAALDRLDEQKSSEAAAAQKDAEGRLVDALDELERALDALRERRRREALGRLQRLLQQMLRQQKSLTAQTADLIRRSAEERRQEAFESLADGEREVSESAAEAAKLLAEHGSQAAFKQALEDVGGRALQVSAALAAGQIGPRTPARQEEIERILEELLAVLEDRQVPPQAQRPPSGEASPEQSGRQQQQGLIRPEAELKVLRFLQERLLNQTAEIERVAPAERAEALKRTEPARRQRRLAETARVLAESVPPLAQVRTEMTGAAEALDVGQVGEPAQAAQRRAIALLEQLLAEMQRNQAQAAASRTPGRPGPTVRPSGPAAVSAAAERNWRTGARRERPDSAAWLTGLPAREREIIETSLKTGEVPIRYRELIRRYNRRLATEEE